MNKPEIKLVQKESLKPKDQMDDELRRLSLALLTVVRRRFPNDFRLMMEKVGVKQAA